MLVFTSAIESIPEELFRAARVDGANAWQIVRRITLPLLQLADPLRADLPDDEPVRLVRVHPADDQRRARACT